MVQGIFVFSHFQLFSVCLFEKHIYILLLFVCLFTHTTAKWGKKNSHCHRMLDKYSFRFIYILYGWYFEQLFSMHFAPIPTLLNRLLTKNGALFITFKYKYNEKRICSLLYEITHTYTLTLRSRIVHECCSLFSSTNHR